MLIEANWEKLSSTINDYSNIVTEPGVSQALEKNLLLYVMSQRSDMRDASGKHLYAKVLDGYKTISNDLNLAPSKSILSLMFMGGFFYDANHLRNVSQILDSQLSKVSINSVALLDALSRYYFRYRDEIRNRLNTNAYTKKSAF
ncbi:MAG: hypothetical protein IPJ69_13895 [Deltaproteobacteria bacterium]|nr:MAG: hypothetical protein IPJ69_13895 [Deltaproteobacteria bacterium]